MSTHTHLRTPVRRLLGGLLGLALAGGSLAVAAQPAAAVADPPGADFNGDGYADLAIGAPGETTNGFESAGRIHVLYGSGSGFDVPGSEWFSQATSLVIGEPEARDFFGQVLASGDFDGDGYDDLAIGSPQEDVGSTFDAGVVQVLYGTSQGLRVDRNQLFSMDTPGIADVPKPGDTFGAALGAGDFDGDGDDDLAIGVPHDYGFIILLEGTSSGLSATQAKNLTLSGGTDHRAYGASMATADLDGDGRDELAVGMPGADVAGKTAAGMVEVMHGSDAFTSFGATWAFFSQQSLFGTSEAFSGFGSVLAAGRTGTDGRADLAIGMPTQAGNDEGAVAVLPGRAAGAPAAGSAYLLRLDTMGIPGVPGVSSGHFGSALAVGDVNGDGKGDLSIGAPGHDDGSTVADGMVVFVPGNAGGLAKAKGKVVRQSSPGVPGDPAVNDRWGSALAMTDPNGDGKASLAVGAAMDDVSGVENAGTVTLLPAVAPWPAKAGVRHLHEDVPDFPDDAEPGDWFGFSLA